MKSEEKAQELILTHMALLSGAGISEKMSTLLAKEISLIECDEIIEALHPFIHEESSAPYFEQKEYWDQVKQHIQSL